MQLFTIGVWMLEEDGTRTLDASGEPIQTYDNNDLLSFSRVWTGFANRPARGNLAYFSRQTVDPMRVFPARRDFFPKSASRLSVRPCLARSRARWSLELPCYTQRC